MALSGLSLVSKLQPSVRLFLTYYYYYWWDYVSELRPLTYILFVLQMTWVWRATVEWYWQEKTEKLVPVPLCPPLIPHGLTRRRTWHSEARGQRLTAWTMERPLSNVSQTVVRRQPVVCSRSRAVSEEEALQKLCQTLNEWKLHPHMSVLKLPLLVDLQQKVGELVLSKLLVLQLLFLKMLQICAHKKYSYRYGNCYHVYIVPSIHFHALRVWGILRRCFACAPTAYEVVSGCQ
jgi:hypothetical protein